MNTRTRVVILAAIVAVAVAGAVWYVIGERNEQRSADRSAAMGVLFDWTGPRR